MKRFWLFPRATRCKINLDTKLYTGDKMADQTIQEFMSRMSGAFQAEKAVGLDVTIQLKLTGTQASVYFIVIKDGKCIITQGTAPVAKLTVTADSDDFIKIFTGQLDGTQAYMQGKLRLAGDMNLALKLLNLFKLK
jgi:putative sterol carrier protein